MCNQNDKTTSYTGYRLVLLSASPYSASQVLLMLPAMSGSQPPDPMLDSMVHATVCRVILLLLLLARLSLAFLHWSRAKVIDLIGGYGAPFVDPWNKQSWPVNTSLQLQSNQTFGVDDRRVPQVIPLGQSSPCTCVADHVPLSFCHESPLFFCNNFPAHSFPDLAHSDAGAFPDAKSARFEATAASGAAPFQVLKLVLRAQRGDGLMRLLAGVMARSSVGLCCVSDGRGGNSSSLVRSP